MAVEIGMGVGVGERTSSTSMHVLEAQLVLGGASTSFYRVTQSCLAPSLSLPDSVLNRCSSANQVISGSLFTGVTICS